MRIRYCALNRVKLKYSIGELQGLKTSIPLGGHTVPISIAGVKLEQKRLKKQRKTLLLKQ